MKEAMPRLQREYDKMKKRRPPPDVGEETMPYYRDPDESSATKWIRDNAKTLLKGAFSVGGTVLGGPLGSATGGAIGSLIGDALEKANQQGRGPVHFRTDYRNTDDDWNTIPNLYPKVILK